MMNTVLQEDINNFKKIFPFPDEIAGASFLITGATGLIGSILVRCLLSLNKDISITCPIRSMDKVRQLYKTEMPYITFVECDLVKYLKEIPSANQFDYIIHCASPTSGLYMTEHPVETYELAIESTKALLDYAAHRFKVKGFVYISSLEYYGQNSDDCLISEDMQGYIDSADPRSSYPLGKRAAEFLCSAYAHQYGVNVKIARLTQTFGAGISSDDNRVFAQFARSVIGGEDIILHTQGDSAKPYCYTIDCISAILYILLRGNKGEAYNVANDSTYISIRQLAKFLCEKFNPEIKVRVELHPEMGYAPVTKLHLDTSKLKGLGWSPQETLYSMFDKLIQSIKYENCRDCQ